MKGGLHILNRVFQSLSRNRKRVRMKVLRASFAKLGQGVELGDTLHIEFPERVTVGSYTYIGPWVKLYGRGGLAIGDNVMIAPEVLIMTTMHRYRNASMVPYDNVELLRPVSVGNGVWLGQRCILMPGVEIAEGCIVASGAVVTKSCAAGEIVGGNPAQVIAYRNMDHYWERVNSGKLFLKVVRSSDMEKEDQRDPRDSRKFNPKEV